MGLHNDKNGARKSSIYAGFRALTMWFEYRLSTKTENNRGAGKPTPLKNMPLSHVGHQGTFNYIVC